MSKGAHTHSVRSIIRLKSNTDKMNMYKLVPLYVYDIIIHYYRKRSHTCSSLYYQFKIKNFSKTKTQSTIFLQQLTMTKRNKTIRHPLSYRFKIKDPSKTTTTRTIIFLFLQH